jgi:hypothetical protein
LRALGAAIALLSLLSTSTTHRRCAPADCVLAVQLLLKLALNRMSEYCERMRAINLQCQKAVQSGGGLLRS